MKFILSYSAGKDSVMALHKMVAAGHEPAGLLVMVNRELQCSWFHGADLPLLREIARSLDIPLLLLLDRLYPLYGCALVQPVVDLISLIVALVLYRRLRRTSVV